MKVYFFKATPDIILQEIEKSTSGMIELPESEYD